MTQSTTITLPSYWAAALIDGDTSGMTPSEIDQMDRTLDELHAAWTVVSDVENSERFTWSYRLYAPFADCEGGTVMDYVALK